MSLETKKLLKLFGVAVTDFEEESKRIIENLGQAKSLEEKVKLLKDTLELINEVHIRWIDVTQFLIESEKRLIFKVIENISKTS
ncbi:hypothetical protein HRbin06_00714 [archaeon HR06]|nr:hypothetical protein HRbin06_00714 [archaeon HR06]